MTRRLADQGRLVPAFKKGLDQGLDGRKAVGMVTLPGLAPDRYRAFERLIALGENESVLFDWDDFVCFTEDEKEGDFGRGKLFETVDGVAFEFNALFFTDSIGGKAAFPVFGGLPPRPRTDIADRIVPIDGRAIKLGILPQIEGKKSGTPHQGASSY
ncbi:hypothetical protein AAFN60_17585 [Roseibacillus persicicus]|uniref:hypothetical protein n=1 Tax=Roseibacillus persicicus TaxID=454148 RepID=UPI00398B8C14